jgi:hypothetical protein
MSPINHTGLPPHPPLARYLITAVTALMEYLGDTITPLSISDRSFDHLSDRSQPSVGDILDWKKSTDNRPRGNCSQGYQLKIILCGQTYQLYPRFSRVAKMSFVTLGQVPLLMLKAITATRSQGLDDRSQDVRNARQGGSFSTEFVR